MTASASSSSGASIASPKRARSAPGGIVYADALRALFGLGIDADVEGEHATLAEAVTVDPEDLRPGDGLP